MFNPLQCMYIAVILSSNVTMTQNGYIKCLPFSHICLANKKCPHSGVAQRFKYARIKILSISLSCQLKYLIKKKKNFSLKRSSYDLGTSLTALICRTNLKLHNICATPKLVQKIISNLDSKALICGPCIRMLGRDLLKLKPCLTSFCG